MGKDRKKSAVIFWATIVVAVVAMGYFVSTAHHKARLANEVREAALQATHDISIKQPCYLNYGNLAPYEDEVETILRERYGVRLDRVAGCDVSESLIRRSDAYNSVISSHFGFTGNRDIFLSTVEELLERHAEKQASP